MASSTHQKHIIFVHGFRGTHHGLQLIADDLTKLTGKQTVTHIPDMPGFAKGDTLETYDLDAYVTWLKDYIKRLGLKAPPIIVGHSFGSIIASFFAAAHPTMLSKLILINPIGAPALEGPRKILSGLAVSYYWLGNVLPEGMGRSWLSSTPSVLLMSTVMAKTHDKALRRFIHQEHLRYFSLFHSPASVYQGFLTSIRHSVRDTAARITTPTLLIAGDQDDITPLEKQKELVKLFPKARLSIIKNVGHLTHYETPEIVAEYIYDFIIER